MPPQDPRSQASALNSPTLDDAMPISPMAQPDVEPRRPEFLRYSLPVTTADTLPGVGEVIGIVIGVTTRPRDLAHHPEMLYINTRARQDALGAMVMQAQQAGADAVVGVRFDSDKISDSVSEITAYGTAVRYKEHVEDTNRIDDWV